jgi:hypothetical protein
VGTPCRSRAAKLGLEQLEQGGGGGNHDEGRSSVHMTIAYHNRICLQMNESHVKRLISVVKGNVPTGQVLSITYVFTKLEQKVLTA